MKTRATGKLTLTPPAMISSSPSGFAHARWIQRVCVGTLASSFLISLMNLQTLFNLQWRPHLVEWGQWQRIILNPLVWTDQSVAIISSIIAYECRSVERQIGSRKMRSFFAESAIISALTVPVVLAILGVVGINIRVPPGPHATIGALVALYHELTPHVYYTRLAGAGVWSDKAFVYVLMLANCTSWGGFLKTAIGWCVAKLIYSDVLPGRNWAF